jgi:hypothetical protein
VAAFTAANNEAITWILNPANRERVYLVIKQQMPLPGDVSDPEATLKRMVDVNANQLSIGIPQAPIEGWNKYLISLKHLQEPIPYEQLVWKTGQP